MMGQRRIRWTRWSVFLRDWNSFQNRSFGRVLKKSSKGMPWGPMSGYLPRDSISWILHHSSKIVLVKDLLIKKQTGRDSFTAIRTCIVEGLTYQSGSAACAFLKHKRRVKDISARTGASSLGCLGTQKVYSLIIWDLFYDLILLSQVWVRLWSTENISSWKALNRSLKFINILHKIFLNFMMFAAFSK